MKQVKFIYIRPFDTYLRMINKRVSLICIWLAIVFIFIGLLLIVLVSNQLTYSHLYRLNIYSSIVLIKMLVGYKFDN